MKVRREPFGGVFSCRQPVFCGLLVKPHCMDCNAAAAAPACHPCRRRLATQACLAAGQGTLDRASLKCPAALSNLH